MCVHAFLCDHVNTCCVDDTALCYVLFPTLAGYLSPCVTSGHARAVLDEMATISAVLYANTNLPELKNDFPVWTERCKQILKKWRALSTEEKAPFLQKARDNRSALRMKKAQHVSTI